MKTTKGIANIVLGFGCVLVFNENIEALWINLTGFACIALLCVINAPASAFEKK